MNAIIARALYFSLQRVRHGVNSELVREAARVLDSGDAWRDHVAVRLAAQFPAGSDSLDWLTRQPLVDRLSIMERSEPPVIPHGVRYERRKTSGSTGVPFTFLKDREMTSRMDAAMWAVYLWHGVQPGDRQARFWGSAQGNVPRFRQKLTDGVQNRSRLSAFNATPEQCAGYFRKLLKTKPKYAYGYPTLISSFVEYCSTFGLDGRDLKLRTIICTGELLQPSTKALIADFFDARVVDEYGCTESGILSISCESGSSHVVPFALFPEIVDDYGNPLPTGETGQVVITDLYGQISPLLRYRLTDRAMISVVDNCACGRSLPILGMQSGRIDSFILTPARGKVYDSILAYTVPAGVLKFSAQQVAIDRITVQLVPGRSYKRETTPELCRQTWERVLGPGMTVEVETVQEIPFSASGKLRYFTPLQGL